MNQPVIPDVALVDNTEQRTPLVIVLDTSGSMNATDRSAVSRFALKSDGRTPIDYSVDARRFAAILARARARVADGAALPPDVKKLAEGPLPQ